MKEVYKKTVLENGIRVVTESIDYVRSISIGVWIDVGSRDEKNDEMGTSHFVEHMLFKGTKKRTAKEIASSLESVGGSLNAFTGREHTCYFARVLDEHTDIALDVLSDILKNPLFNPSHLEKERTVIISEIKELEDSPADLVHDLLMSTIWKENPLGKPIIGSVDSVLKLTRSKLIDFMKRNYIFPRVVIAASGNFKHEELVNKIKREFRFGSDSHPVRRIQIRTSEDQMLPQAEPNRMVAKRKTAQTHINLGVSTFPYRDRRRYAALVLSNILGGGMSSRLFQSIREKLGLVYSVYTFLDFFEDAGVFGIYMGTNKKNTVRVIELVLKEIRKLKKDSLTSKELSHAKYQLKGNLLLALESTSNRMNRVARYELLLHDYVDLDQTINSINKIKAKDVIEVAEEFFSPDKLSAVVLGPVGKGMLNQVDWGEL
ncbi:MAG: insulinase family protein [candidate division Zixibacteria bacterium]|nr:insulinase family protein [candidate division Zixibacteria bacterium]